VRGTLAIVGFCCSTSTAIGSGPGVGGGKPCQRPFPTPCAEPDHRAARRFRADVAPLALREQLFGYHRGCNYGNPETPGRGILGVVRCGSSEDSSSALCGRPWASCPRGGPSALITRGSALHTANRPRRKSDSDLAGKTRKVALSSPFAGPRREAGEALRPVSRWS
jgi:hypothetical protein